MRSNLQLFCTPAINLFDKPRIDRIHVNDSTFEFHVVADRTRPLDYEIYQVTEVVGHGAGDDTEQRFLPFYSASSADVEHLDSAYFTTRREPRLVSRNRSGAGTDRATSGPKCSCRWSIRIRRRFPRDLRQLSMRALCTNRDLVLQMPIGLGQTDFSLSIAAPVAVCGSWPAPVVLSRRWPRARSRGGQSAICR